ncbi:MAG: polyprenyl synthetase family protein [Candidatus Bathyarchaeia archaeon]
MRIDAGLGRSSSADTPETQTDILEEMKLVSNRVNSVLDKVLSRGSPEVLYMASRHLIKAGGKMLRPYLTFKSCELLGGDVEAVLPSAAAVELLHTFTLIHDDIIDHDEVRRGVPTVHSLWGIPLAIVAGDLLFAKVGDTITGHTNHTRVSPQQILRVLATLNNATVNICEGQVLDMIFPSIEGVSEDDYVTMIGKKTSYLFKAAAEIGGIIGGGSEEEIASLGRFAYAAGLAFQITDDVLGLTSTLQELGKPVGSDLKGGKKILPLIYAISHLTAEERAKIQGLLSGSPRPEEIIWVRNLIDSTGAIQYASTKAREYLAKALSELEMFTENAAKRALVKFSHFLVERRF